jgi:hypothetical protein
MCILDGLFGFGQSSATSRANFDAFCAYLQELQVWMLTTRNQLLGMTAMVGSNRLFKT